MRRPIVLSLLFVATLLYWQYPFEYSNSARTPSSISSVSCIDLLGGVTSGRGELLDSIRQTQWYQIFDEARPDNIPAVSALKRQPNTPIQIDASTQKRLQRLLKKSSYAQYERLLQMDQRPHVLMAATEFGKIGNMGTANPVQAKIGGLAVVVNDMIDNLPKFLKQQGDGKISFAFMGYNGIPLQNASLVKKFTISMGDSSELVSLFRYQHENGAMLYFLDAPSFNRRPLTAFDRIKKPRLDVFGNPVYIGRGRSKKLVTEEVQINLYSPWPRNGKAMKFYQSLDWQKMSVAEQKAFNTKLTDQELLDLWVKDAQYASGRFEWEEAYDYSLYNKAISLVQQDIGANIYHAHDYHTAMAAVHMNDDVSVAMTIHNAGAAYHGRYWTKGYGDGYRIPSPGRPNGIPSSGDPQMIEDHKKLLDIIGISEEQFYDYFEDPQGRGDVVFMNALKYIEDRNLLAGMPVSRGYVDSLARSRDDIVQMVMNETGRVPRNVDELYNANGDLPALIKGNLDGVENGLSMERHAANNEFLKKLNLNFGDDLVSPEGIAKVSRNKAVLKEMLQKEYNLEIKADAPLFTVVARFVEQKDIDIFVENINYIVRQGGQVLIGGAAGDDTGMALVKKLDEIVKLPQNQGKVFFVNGFVNASYFQAGSDFFVIPSKFEPCGLTDIEAMWLGAIPIVRNIDGLGKTVNSIKYNWSDSSNSLGHIYKLRKALDQAFDLYVNHPDELVKMRVGGLQEVFSLDIQFSKIYENYRTAALYKLIKTFEGQAKGEVLAQEVFKSLPDDMVENFFRLLAKKESPSDFELSLVVDWAKHHP